jgi:hypothetical protein
VVCGLDHFKWTGYTFLHSASYDGSYKDREFPDNGQDADDYYDSDDDEIEEDFEEYFTGDCSSFSCTLGLTLDPRTYFLRTTSSRILLAVQEYDYLVHMLEAGLHSYVSSISHAL